MKDYGENGFLSKYLCEDLEIGAKVNFKHIDFNVKIPAPFKQKKIGMIAGGKNLRVTVFRVIYNAAQVKYIKYHILLWQELESPQ